MATLDSLPCGIRLYVAFFVACVFLAATVSSSEVPDSWSQTKVSPLKKCHLTSDLSLGKRKAFLQRLEVQCKKHKASSFFCDNLQLLLTLTTQSSKCNQMMAADVEPSLSDTLISHPSGERDDFKDDVMSHVRRNKRDTSVDVEHDDKVEGAGDGSENEGTDREDRALKPKGDLIEDPAPDKHAVNIKKIDHMYDNLKSVLDWMMGLQVCDPQNESKCAEGRQLTEVKDTLRYAVHMAVDQARDFFKNLSPSVQEALESSRTYEDIWSSGLNSVRSWIADAVSIRNSGNNDVSDSLARKINNWDHNMDSMTKWILEKGSSYLEDSKISKEKWYNNLNVVVNWAVKRGKAYFDIPDSASIGENSAEKDVFVDNAAHAIARILPDQVTDLLVPQQTELESQEDGKEEEEEDDETGEGEEARDASTRRRGRKKKRRFLRYFAAVAAVKAVLIKWGAIMSIKALAFKAMVLSSVALTMAIIAAFKKIGSGGGHSKVVVASHHTAHDDHEWEDHWESSSQGGPGPGVEHGGWSSGGGGGGDQGWSSSQGGPIGGWGGRHPSGGGGGGGNWQTTGGGGGWNNGGGGGGGGWNNWNGPGGGGGGGGWGGNGGWGGKGWNRAATSWVPGQNSYAFPSISEMEEIQKRQGDTHTSAPAADDVPIAR